MRILFVHERFGAFGGAEVNALLTAAGLKRRGHEISILHGEPTSKAEAEWRETFSPCFPLRGQSPQASVQAAIAAFQPDVIYVHKIADLEILRALVESNRPLVRMVHDHDLYCMRSYKYHPLTRNICERPMGIACIFPCGATVARNRNGGFPLRWVSYSAKKNELELNRQFHRMIVAGDYMRQELLRNGFDPARIEIHAPVPHDEVKAIASSFGDSNRIVFAGQIIRGKGVGFLLRALALIHTPFTCEILGDGSHRAHCEALSAELGLTGRVHFHGYLPPTEMDKYYRDATVAAVSSVWPEPFGMIGIEAMRRGLPVVAFDVGGVREWLRDGENGFLVPQKDCAKFATRLEQLLQDKSLARRLGEAGQRFAYERFNFNDYLTGLEKMFVKVAEKPQNGTRAAIAGVDKRG
ncbi:MAG TPA: glycosyltransferase family 4 protein [Verrucomicrobiae bacterium]|jgi:glycosyltransferase involved in cell wall biosynthesis|nr:glycosyltransferase family 4 protein [Verrucomicrobiae bacterium]